MKITLIEPYFSGSHKAWAEGYQRCSSHQITILSLQGRHWKWRMYGGAVSLARQFTTTRPDPDLILATDMLDLSTFLSLTRKETSALPVAIYFHENQITYPWSEEDADRIHGRDNHYGFTNFTSALSADAVFFNSNFHKNAFLDELTPFLKQFPDHRETNSITALRSKSQVLQLGLDLQKFDRFRKEKTNEVPVIIWNHRWEYDKNPDDFFNALFWLQEQNLPFKLIVLGENYSKFPPIFALAYRKLKDHILHWGFVENFADYAALLWSADIALTTSNQDFFGGSVLEAMYCECYPILPNRLAYPEHFPEGIPNQHFYNTFEELLDLLSKAVSRPLENEKKIYAKIPVKYDWANLHKAYDMALGSLAG